ncbi:MAG: sulfite exporter TauE/SafE family protein [Gemmatimonadaceae bacterium]
MTLLLGVLAASLVGSIHCAAMCGGFVCVYAGASTPRGLHNLRAHVAYNGGRLVSYVALGIAAGAIGARVDDLGRFAGFGRGAAVLAGTLMVAWALGIIAASFGVRVPGTLAPAWATRRLGAALNAIRPRPPVARAAATGLLTTLLPCGWLYTFVVTAGGTGSPLAGAGVMFAFWLGTVPVLLSLGLGAQRLLGPVARRLPLASAALVLVLGLLSIAGRVHPPAMHMRVGGASGTPMAMDQAHAGR